MSVRANRRFHQDSKAAQPAAKALLKQMLITLGLFAALTLCAFAMFISPALAGFGICFIGFGLLGYSELKRRKNWENAFRFRLQRVENVQDALTGDVLQNARDIRDLKHETNRLAHEAEMRAVDIEADEQITSINAPQRVSGLIANDDPFSEHASLSNAVIGELVHQAIRNQRVEIFVQPIVRLPQRQPVGYELFARIRAKAGLYVPASRYMPAARKEHLQNEIDLLLLKESLKTLQDMAAKNRFEANEVFFINIEPSTLKHRKYISTLLNFLAKNRALARHLVFEMEQEAFEAMPAVNLKLLKALGQLGCSFSIDHAQTLEFNTQKYLDAHIGFIKMNAQKLLPGLYERDDMTIARRHLEKNGMRIIADRIEHESVMPELLDQHLRFGQGHVFGKPEVQGAYRPFAFTRSAAKRQGVKESFG